MVMTRLLVTSSTLAFSPFMSLMTPIKPFEAPFVTTTFVLISRAALKVFCGGGMSDAPPPGSCCCRAGFIFVRSAEPLAAEPLGVVEMSEGPRATNTPLFSSISRLCKKMKSDR